MKARMTKEHALEKGEESGRLRGQYESFAKGRLIIIFMLNVR